MVQFYSRDKLSQQEPLNLYLAMGQMEAWWLDALLPTRKWRPKVHMRLDFKKIILITHLERNCAEESVTRLREHVMHYSFSQVEGFLVEWSFFN